MTQFARLTRVGQLRRIYRAAEQAARAYGLAGVRLSPLAHGHDHVFDVAADKGQFVLRIQPEVQMPTAWVLSQLSWLRAIRAETDVAVPLPVSLPDGRWVLSLQLPGDSRQYQCMLLEWVDGRRSRRPEDFLRPQKLKTIGATIARLHQHASTFALPVGFACRRWDADTLVGAGSALGSGLAQRYAEPADFG